MNDSNLATILLNLARAGVPGKDVPDTHVLHADAATLEDCGIAPELARRIVSLRERGAVRAELARAANDGVRITARGTAEFPLELTNHLYAPAVLYRRGALPPRPRVGIVGARAASTAMIAFAERVAEGVGRHSIAVVSGLARGIDAAAHRGALRGDPSGRGCVGVLGCGLDVVYPPDTSNVRNRMWNDGALLTTFPFGTPPLQHHFPLRNRLLAALCDAVVVVQARRDSGSMSTARAALDAGIEVFAVPGSPDDPLSGGPNSLLRDGARPVLEPADIVEALLGIGSYVEPGSEPDSAQPDDPLCGAILREIGSIAADAASIAAAIGVPPDRVLARLVELELDGWVHREPGGVFRRRNPKPGT